MEREKDKKQKKNFFEFLTEAIGWIQIVLFPLFLSAIIGFLIYIANPTNLRLIIAIAITTAGLTIGIIWATRVWKKRGTIDFISRASASPELDNLEN